jgi:hypothetical protein
MSRGRKTTGTRYDRRNAILREMGFASYKAYLASELWRKIRRTVLCDGNACLVCGKQATQVHHTNYTLANLTGESLEFMVPVCRDCHEAIEFSDRGRKRTLKQANQKLDILTGVINEPVPEVRPDQGRGECCRCGKTIARSQSYCWHCSKLVYGGKKRKASERYRPTKPPVQSLPTKSVWRG